MTAVALALMLAPAAMAGGNCCPDEGEGQLAELDYGRSDVRWFVVAEHVRVRLTVSTPCGVFDRVYDKGEAPSFSIAELGEDNPNGQYTWQIRIEQPVDPAVQKALKAARESGDDRIVGELRRKGLLPSGPFIQTGEFTVMENAIVPPGGFEKGAEGLRVSNASSGGAQRITAADIVHNDDIIIHNSLCVGFDCINNEVFNADTIRMKENNVRIHAEDTSSLAGFPSTDWRLEFNSQSSGGLNYFRVIDATTSRNIMTLEGAAPSNSLVVDDAGRVGLGTANPVVELHVVDGDTPTLRLEQDTSSGFAAQTWDVAGNETNFFVRDVTGGSTLPFRIFPGASSSSLVIDDDSDVGIGTASPGTFSNGGDQAALHIRRTLDTDAGLLIERATSTPASDPLLEIRNNGTPRIDMVDSNSGSEWRFEASASGFNINELADAGTAELVLQTDGDLVIEGDLTANGTNYPSSRTLKEDFAPVDTREVLQRLARVPVSLWTYKSDADKRRHIGPVTEDFGDAFDFLPIDGKLSTIDLHGVALAAIQGLNELVLERSEHFSALVAEKDARIKALEARLEAIEELTMQEASGDE
jgi:hypothetical protein